MFSVAGGGGGPQPGVLAPIKGSRRAGPFPESKGAERVGEIMDITRTSVATKDACISCHKIKVYRKGLLEG